VGFSELDAEGVSQLAVSWKPADSGKAWALIAPLYRTVHGGHPEGRPPFVHQRLVAGRQTPLCRRTETTAKTSANYQPKAFRLQQGSW